MIAATVKTRGLDERAIIAAGAERLLGHAPLVVLLMVDPLPTERVGSLDALALAFDVPRVLDTCGLLLIALLRAVDPLRTLDAFGLTLHPLPALRPLRAFGALDWLTLEALRALCPLHLLALDALGTIHALHLLTLDALGTIHALHLLALRALRRFDALRALYALRLMLYALRLRLLALRALALLAATLLRRSLG